MRILLVEPSDTSVPGLNFGGLFIMEPMSLELIAASVPEHEVKIVDLRLDPFTIEYHLNDFKPHIVGVTGISAVHNEMNYVVSCAKKVGAFTVAGGPHASFAYKALSNLDAVVIGEGEGTFHELVSALDTNSDLSLVPNLAWHNNEGWIVNRTQIYDLWPLPRRCLARDYKYSAFGLDVAMVEATRGCPHRCNFCITPKLFGGRYKVRPVKEIVDYISTRPEPFVMFPDADWMASSKYLASLLNEIKIKVSKKYGVALRADDVVSNPTLVEEWSRAGLCFVFIGFEGYRQSQLNSYNKDSNLDWNSQAVSILHRCNIISIGTMIVEPDWSKQQFDECLVYTKKLGSDITMFSVLTPFPGAPMSEGVEVIATYDKFDVLHAVTETALPYEEFQENFMRISKAALLNKSLIKLLWRLVKRKLIRVSSIALLGRIRSYIKRVMLS